MNVDHEVLIDYKGLCHYSVPPSLGGCARTLDDAEAEVQQSAKDNYPSITSASTSVVLR